MLWITLSALVAQRPLQRPSYGLDPYGCLAVREVISDLDKTGEKESGATLSMTTDKIPYY